MSPVKKRILFTLTCISASVSMRDAKALHGQGINDDMCMGKTLHPCNASFHILRTLVSRPAILNAIKIMKIA